MPRFSAIGDFTYPHLLFYVEAKDEQEAAEKFKTLEGVTHEHISHNHDVEMVVDTTTIVEE